MNGREAKIEKLIKDWYYEAYGDLFIHNYEDMVWYFKDNTVHIYTHDMLYFAGNDKVLLSIFEKKLAKYGCEVQLHEFAENRITRIPI